MSGGYVGGITPTPGTPIEKLAPPLDKMPQVPVTPKVTPKAPEVPKGGNPQVQIETQPTIPQISTPPAIIPPVPAAPSVNNPPAPRVDGDRREPF